MTKEQLEKANELNKEISNVKNAVKYLEEYHGVELSVCKWSDGMYSNGYKHIVTLDDNTRTILANYYKDILKGLEKQLEEL